MKKATQHPGFDAMATKGKQHPGFKHVAAKEAAPVRGIAKPPAAIAPVAPIGPPQMPGGEVSSIPQKG